MGLPPSHSLLAHPVLLALQEWCRAAGAECLAVQPPGRNMRSKEAPITTCQALAAALLPVVASRLQEGGVPYVVRAAGGQTARGAWRASSSSCDDIRFKLPCRPPLPRLLRRSWRTAWAPGLHMSSCAWRSAKACPCPPEPSCRARRCCWDGEAWDGAFASAAGLSPAVPPPAHARCLLAHSLACCCSWCSHGVARHPLGPAALAPAAGPGRGAVQGTEG